jgi:signal-transduction protein with cAMP-binding, CBS, and nucleotidyltransferase domain
LLFLCRAEFDARTSAGDPATLALRQRIVEIVCARLRRNYASVSEPATAPAGLQREPLRAIAPPRSYIARLELFRTLTPGQLDEVLSRGTVTCGPRGLVVQRAGTRPLACYVTLNGGVEDIHGATRVGFSGPGRACGYVGLLDDQPAPVSSVARERCLLLALDPDHFATLRRSQPAFARAIEADLIRTVTTADAASSRHGLDQTA